jgi:hypothetical protein
VPKVVRLLDRLVKSQDVPADYMYYSLPSPWMQVATPAREATVGCCSDSCGAGGAQVKCMRILQQYPIADDPSLAGAVSSTLQRIIAVRDCFAVAATQWLRARRTLRH